MSANTSSRPLSLSVNCSSRIPGVSSDWIVEHVRADVETTRGEIEAAGFEFVRSIDLLEENYIIEFERP